MPEFDPIAYRVYSDWAKRGDRSSKAVYRAINEAARATKAWLDSPPTAEQHPYPGIWQRLAAAIADPSPGEQRLAGAVQHAQAEPVAEAADYPTATQIRCDLDSALEAAEPFAGGTVRAHVIGLRRALARADAQRRPDTTPDPA